MSPCPRSLPAAVAPDAAAPLPILQGAVEVPVKAPRVGHALPNARILELDGVGPFPYLEAPGVFFAAVDRFLRGEWPEAARVVAR